MPPRSDSIWSAILRNGAAFLRARLGRERRPCRKAPSSPFSWRSLSPLLRCFLSIVRQPLGRSICRKISGMSSTRFPMPANRAGFSCRSAASCCFWRRSRGRLCRRSRAGRAGQHLPPGWHSCSGRLPCLGCSPPSSSASSAARGRTWMFTVIRSPTCRFPGGPNSQACRRGTARPVAAAAVAIGALWPRARPLMWLYALTIMLSRVVVLCASSE